MLVYLFSNKRRKLCCHFSGSKSAVIPWDKWERLWTFSKITESKMFNYIFHLACSKEHVTNGIDMPINAWQSVNPIWLAFFVRSFLLLSWLFTCVYQHKSQDTFLVVTSWFFSTHVNQTFLNFFFSCRIDTQYKTVSYSNHCHLRLSAYRRNLCKQNSAFIASMIWLSFSFKANIFLVTTPDQGFLPLHFNERFNFCQR